VNAQKINIGTLELYDVKIAKNVAQASRRLPLVKHMRIKSARSVQR